MHDSTPSYSTTLPRLLVEQGELVNDLFRFFHIVKHSEVANAQLPFGQFVGTQLLSISRQG